MSEYESDPFPSQEEGFASLRTVVTPQVFGPRYFKLSERPAYAGDLYDYRTTVQGDVDLMFRGKVLTPSRYQSVHDMLAAMLAAENPIIECDEHGTPVQQVPSQNPSPQEKAGLPVRESLISEALVKVKEEVDRAVAKHGNDPWSRHEFLGILLEEVDEAKQDIFSDAPQNLLLTEVVQIAAVCVRYLETHDRHRGKHPTF